MKEMEEISLEQYIEKNKDKLIKEYRNINEEDFVIIYAQNPENPKQIIELNFQRYQYERFKGDSKNFGFTVEELAFIALMFALAKSENVPYEEKKKIRLFIDRQMTKIRNNMQIVMYK